jgi:hypothetical protein
MENPQNNAAADVLPYSRGLGHCGDTGRMHAGANGQPIKAVLLGLQFILGDIMKIAVILFHSSSIIGEQCSSFDDNTIFE